MRNGDCGRRRSPNLWRSGQEAQGPGLGHGLAPVVCVELLVEVNRVLADGVGGDGEVGGDLLVGQASLEEKQDVDLAVGQPAGQIGRAHV